MKYKGQTSEKMQTTSFSFECKIVLCLMRVSGRQFLHKLSRVHSLMDYFKFVFPLNVQILILKFHTVELVYMFGFRLESSRYFCLLLTCFIPGIWIQRPRGLWEQVTAEMLLAGAWAWSAQQFRRCMSGAAVAGLCASRCRCRCRDLSLFLLPPLVFAYILLYLLFVLLTVCLTLSCGVLSS